MQVIAVTAVGLYGWTTYRFLQKLPSWLFYLRPGGTFANYSHAVVFNLLEVLVFVGTILLINILLPAKLFRHRFVARASLFSILILGCLIYLALAIGESKTSQFPLELFGWALLVVPAILVLAILLPSNDRIRKIIEGFADRLVIFLYVLLPVTVVGLLIFLLNNVI